MLLSSIGLYVLALLIAVAGISHLYKPEFYVRLLPLWLPAHRIIVVLSGLVEVVLALGLLLPATRDAAALATVIMLAAYLLVHVNMLIDRDAGLGFPRWGLLLRLVFQFVLIGWAWHYT